MVWELKIRKVENGFIIEHEDADHEVEGTMIQHLITIVDNPMDETDHAELKAMHDLLWYVKEYFAVVWSKHHKENLDIEIKKIDAAFPDVSEVKE